MHLPTTVFQDHPDAPEMVVIQGGTFLMGSPESEKGRYLDEGPQHKVTVPRFALGRTPVIFDQYADFCAENNWHLPDDKSWGRGLRPVINVSHEDAQAYCAWLTARCGAEYRLPTEAEWEYACRAGTTTRYWWGDDDAGLEDHTWCDKNSGARTQPVGAPGHANAWGLSDMHGNVWEWCEDCWKYDYSEPGRPDDGSPWLIDDYGRRVVRGGSWYNDARFLRAAYRYGDLPSNRDDNLGFRVARTL